MFKRLITSHALRRRTSWLIAAVLILPFVIFFHATGQSPVKGPGGIAGELFGKAIAWDTFEQQRLWTRRQWENRLGEFPEGLDGMLTQMVWDRMLLMEEAKRRRVRVTDTDLAAFIARIPAFQENGRFQPERYHQFLAAIRSSPQTFESLLRSDLLIERLINQIKSSVAVNDEEVRAAFERAHERVTASLWVVESASFMKDAEAAVTEDAIRAWYDAHGQELRAPEQLRLEYVGASMEELSSQITPRDEDLTAYYEDHPDAFTQEDGSRKTLDAVKEDIRHLVRDEQARKQLTTLGLDLQEDVEVKLRFEEMAGARGLTIRTAGPIPAGGLWASPDIEPAMLRAITNLPEGQMTEVIATDRGVFVARVTERIPSRLPPLEEVRTDIKQSLIRDRAREAAKAHAEALRAANEPPARSVSFTRTDPIEPLGHVPAVNEAAFATPISQLTDVLEMPQGFVFLRPEQRTPADPAKFDEEQAALRQQTLAQKQAEAVETWLKDLRVRARLRSYVE